MATIKITAELRDRRTCQDWSTSLFRTANDTGAVADITAQWINKMAACFGGQTVVTKVYAKDIDKRALSETIQTAKSGLAFKDDPNERSYRAIRIGVESVEGYSANYSIRGIPDDEVQRSSLDNSWYLSVQLTKNLNEYLEFLAAGGWLFTSKTRPEQATTKMVEKMSVSTDTNTYTITSTAHGYTTGDLIVFFGTNIASYPALRGKHFATVLNDDTLAVVGETDCIPNQYPGGLNMFKPEQVYPTISRAFYKGISRHKTGLPKGVSPGRRPNRKSSRYVLINQPSS